MKLLNINEDDKGPVNWNNAQPKDTQEAYDWAVRQDMSARHQMDVFTKKLAPFEKHVITAWNGEFKTPVSHKIKNQYTWWGIPKGTPHEDEMFRAIKFYVERRERARKLQGRYSRLVSKLKKQSRTESFNDMKYKVKPVIFPSTSVPRRIHYTPDNYFNNPYWTKECISRYAGTVGHFDKFTPAERTTLVELDRTLRRYGIGGMEKLYGCTVQNGKWQDNRFVVIGGDEKVIWKHMGGNIVYVDGKRISMSILTNAENHHAVARQKDILRPLMPKADVKEAAYPNYKELGITEPGEWDNHPHVVKTSDFYPSSGNNSPRSEEILQFERDRARKGQSFKKQEDIICRRLYDIADEFPNELLVRALPDQNDEWFLDHYHQETLIPAAVQANPDAYQMIELSGAMFWEDMRSGDEYPDGPYEEFYILKSSPRYKYILNLLNRYKQLEKLKMNVWHSMPVIRLDPNGKQW